MTHLRERCCRSCSAVIFTDYRNELYQDRPRFCEVLSATARPTRTGRHPDLSTAFTPRTQAGRTNGRYADGSLAVHSISYLSNAPEC